MIVLKFGGSVLRDELRLRIAVHEIYRWRREGFRVVAVVSAIEGRTRGLIDRCEELSPRGDSAARASVVALGEQESSALLGLHLDRAGVPACVLTPAALRLIAEGDPLDADPVSVETGLIESAFERDEVVVVPGFTGVSRDGRGVVLGRGGSDLSAVFLADALGAERCRLIKDVDGLYTSDPSEAGATPLRYSTASYADALATDGSIIQHKAIRYAERRGAEIELGGFNGVRPTRICGEASAFAGGPERPRPLSIGLCGVGTVGSGVLELVRQLPDRFEVVGVACRSLARHADLAGCCPLITEDPLAVAESGADVIVELIGGVNTAHEIARAALGSGSNLVTANKALIAEHGRELGELAESAGVQVRCSASVGGAVPVLEAIGSEEVRSVVGVLNGTGNFVLGALARGETLQQAVCDAQLLGFAEADASRDLDGVDSLDKLRVIAQRLDWTVPEGEIELESIATWSLGNAGQLARHVARLERGSASVLVEPVERDSVFGSLDDEWNAVVIELEDGTSRTLRGRGAGRWPTSESVLADLLELSRLATVRGEKEAAEYV